MKSLRVALYIRVSTPGQVDAFGYDAQKRLLTEYCQKQGWTVVDTYEEPGVSGESILYRPAMQRLLRDAGERRFDVALAIEEQRFSRGGMLDWGALIQVCDEANVRLATPNGTVYQPGDRNSRLWVWIKGGMSEQEKLDIMARFERGRNEALAAGCLPHSMAPFGYRFARRAKDPDPQKRQKHEGMASYKRLEIVEEQAEVVRLIFQLAAHGDGDSGPMGTVLLSRHLNRLNIPAPTAPKWGRAKPGSEQEQRGTGARWTHGSVGQIIKNGVYRGVWHYGKEERIAPSKPRPSQWVGDQPTKPGRSSTRSRPEAEWSRLEDPEIIPPIVSEDLWRAANEARARRNHNTLGRPSERENRPMLSGFLRCPHCGYSITHIRKSYLRQGQPVEARYYVCIGRSHSKSTRRCAQSPCPNQRWAAAKVEAAAWEVLKRVIQSPEMLRGIVADAEQSLPRPDYDELPLVDQNLSEVHAATERVKAAWRAGIYSSLEEFEQELSHVRKQGEALESRLAELQEQARRRAEWDASLAEAIDYCKAYRQSVEHVEEDEKRGVFEDLVEEIHLDKNGRLEFMLFFGTSVGHVTPGSKPDTASASRITAPATSRRR